MLCRLVPRGAWLHYEHRREQSQLKMRFCILLYYNKIVYLIICAGAQLRTRGTTLVGRALRRFPLFPLINKHQIYYKYKYNNILYLSMTNTIGTSRRVYVSHEHLKHSAGLETRLKPLLKLSVTARKFCSGKCLITKFPTVCLPNM